jgi:glycosyltransferase involved in cell wall biosynthesis
MSKPTFIISSAFDTYSGYGSRSRDVIKAIIATDKYDVKLLSQRWGSTSFGFCKDNAEWSNLLDLVIPQPLTEQPDIWMQITVPNEFQPIGKYNIGVTAGIESTLVPIDWIEGVNKMDLNLVSSHHSKNVFLSTEAKQDNQVIRVTKPIEVLFEGANTDIYKFIDTPCSLDFDFPESFAYLMVGHWMQGDIGEDRKNVGLLVKAFYETFKNKSKKPALILKTSTVSSSHTDRDEILRRIKILKETVNSNDLPNIYLLHGDFTDEEMNEIYNHSKIKAMVSLTKGEGFGRPLLEFSFSKKPIIVSGWSGHMDFLSKDFNIIIGGTLTPIHPSVANQFLLKESQWFSPNHPEIGTALKNVFENYKQYKDLGKRQAHKSKTEFSWDAMSDLLSSMLEKNIPEFPKMVTLQLPKLKKI